MKKKLAILIISLVSGACLADQHGLSVDSAFVRDMPPGRTVTAAFFQLTNEQSTDCRLVRIASPIAGRAEIHNHHHEDGMMKMRPVASVNVPAGETVSFEPGGLHIMLFDVQPLTDHTNVALTLHFDVCGSLRIDAQVRSVRG